MIVLRAVKRCTSCTSIEQTLFKQIMTRDKVLDLVHFFLLKKLLCICTVGFCDQTSSWSSTWRWTEELCNRQFSQLVLLKSRTGIRATVSHVLGSRALERGTITTEQVQLSIGVRVQLSIGKVLGIPLLVTTYCDNSRVSGMVTWKSLGGVFAVRFFPIRKQITVLFIFRCVISLLVICLCYHAFAW